MDNSTIQATDKCEEYGITIEKRVKLKKRMPGEKRATLDLPCKKTLEEECLNALIAFVLKFTVDRKR